MSDKMLQDISSIIVQRLDEMLGNKMVSVILYGSYARGDYDSESDIDIAIIAKMSRVETNSYTKQLALLMTDLNFEYDVLVSFVIIPEQEYDQYKTALPYYRNIETQGVKISA